MESSSGNHNQELLALITEKARQEGAITFARYMGLALYHPQLGYYSRAKPRIGPEGDYYTSTDVSPLFGATIGRQVLQMWELLGRPRPFHVVEHGAGKGLLAADLLGWAGAAHPDLFGAIKYTVVEISAGLRAYQQEKLKRLPVTWAEPGSLRPDTITGCLLSNEVADALPVHRVRCVGGQLRELCVVAGEQGLREEPGPLSTPLLATYLDEHGIAIKHGQTAEISLEAPQWMRSQVRALHRGWVLTVDYGGPAAEVYGPGNPDGTLTCYYRHTTNREPFERVGEQDLTAHVNFSALARAAREEEGQVEGLTSQAYFLAALGLGEALQWSVGRASSQKEFERDRNAVEELIRPDGLGSFKVLLCSKGVGPHSPTGLSLARQEV